MIVGVDMYLKQKGRKGVMLTCRRSVVWNQENNNSCNNRSK
jgi:hypothetical protein